MSVGQASCRSRSAACRPAPRLPSLRDERPDGRDPCLFGLDDARGRQRRARSRAGRRVLGEHGAVAAELVIATPLLLLLIMGVIQFALWQHAEHVAEAAAQQALSVGRLQGETAAAGQAEAETVLAQLGSGVLVGPVVHATRGATVTTVVVSGHAESVVGLFTLPVRAVAAGPTEILTAPGQAP